MNELAREVADRRPLGEMAFSVGRPGDQPQVERTVGLAFDAEGGLVAYVTWLWLPAAATVVLDEVKRSRQAPSGPIELLIAASLQELRGQAARASLGLAPVAAPTRAPGWPQQRRSSAACWG